jgi:hypothetical protein
MRTFFDTAATKPRISKDSIDKLYTIRQQAVDERQPMISMYQSIGKYFNPSMSDWSTDVEAGQTVPNYKDIYDSTGVRHSARLADGIQAYAFSRASAWMRIATEDPDLMKYRLNAAWLQDMEVHMYRQLNQSPWYDEARSFVKCGGDFGFAVMIRTNNVARALPGYQTLHPKRCLLVENESGEVDTLFRDLWLTPFDAASAFGYEGLPTRIQEAFRQGRTARWLFHHFEFPTEKFDLDIGARETKGKPYYDLYVPDCDHSNPQQEGGHESKNFFAWRWSKSADGGPYGCDSPGMLAVSDVMQLNGMTKGQRRSEQLAERPPLKATRGLKNRIVMTPNGITELAPGEDFTAAMIVGNTQIAEDTILRMQKGVGETYHKDLFLLLTSNIERIKTATEVEGIKGEQAAMLTAFHGRLSTEFLEPSTEDLFSLEMASGRAPPPPRSLAGRSLKIDLVSPLAQLQKRYLLLDNTKQFLAEVAVITSEKGLGYSEGIDNVNLNEHIRQIGEMYHVNQKVIRDMVDVQKIRAARAAQQQAILKVQLQEQQAKAQAVNYQAARQAPEAGSPAERTMGAQA